MRSVSMATDGECAALPRLEASCSLALSTELLHNFSRDGHVTTRLFEAEELAPYRPHVQQLAKERGSDLDGEGDKVGGDMGVRSSASKLRELRIVSDVFPEVGSCPMEKLLLSPRLLEAASALLGTRACFQRGRIAFKQPGDRGTHWHFDVGPSSTPQHEHDKPAVVAWIAFTPVARHDGGALKFWSGSHRTRQFERSSDPMRVVAEASRAATPCPDITEPGIVSWHDVRTAHAAYPNDGDSTREVVQGFYFPIDSELLAPHDDDPANGRNHGNAGGAKPKGEERQAVPEGWCTPPGRRVRSEER
jgi:hypothetical protein